VPSRRASPMASNQRATGKPCLVIELIKGLLSSLPGLYTAPGMDSVTGRNPWYCPLHGTVQSCPFKWMNCDYDLAESSAAMVHDVDCWWQADPDTVTNCHDKEPNESSIIP
jgi:hypothetical protein